MQYSHSWLSSWL